MPPWVVSSSSQMMDSSELNSASWETKSAVQLGMLLLKQLSTDVNPFSAPCINVSELYEQSSSKDGNISMFWVAPGGSEPHEVSKLANKPSAAGVLSLSSEVAVAFVATLPITIRISSSKATQHATMDVEYEVCYHDQQLHDV